MLSRILFEAGAGGAAGGSGGGGGAAGGDGAGSGAASGAGAGAAAAAGSGQPASAAGKPNLTSAYENLDRILAAGDPGAGEGAGGEGAAGAGAAGEGQGKQAGDKGGEGAGKGQGQGEGTQGAQNRPEKAASLREKATKLETENLQLKTRIQELEKRPTDFKGSDEFKNLSKERDDFRGRYDESQKELRFTNYTRTQEYKEKFETPFVNAYAAGQAKAKALKVPEIKSETDDSVLQAARQGAESDFDQLMQIVDDDVAAEFAQKRFGAKAPLMLYHREKVVELNGARLNAIEKWRQEGESREIKMREDAEKSSEAMQQAYETENKTAADKYPQWFKPVEGDTKGNQLLEQGFALADLAFNQAEMAKLTPQERIRVWSGIRNKAAGFDRLAMQLREAKKLLEEANTKIKGFEESEPGEGAGSHRQAGGALQGMAAVDARIESMAKGGA
jgi:hypothetical protein